MKHQREVYIRVLHDPVVFAAAASGLRLRRYQVEPALGIFESIRRGLGLSFVVIFPRQSGKNELQAQIEAFLLAALQTRDAEIVKVSPTWKPQSLNAMRRLRRVLERNYLTHQAFATESGYIFKVGRARVYFLSGGPAANVVGATANVLLSCDEAQDVLISKWDKDFAPMAASTNATKVFWGTMWTSTTLLARELRAARQAEGQDGMRRVFLLAAGDVAAEVPAYGLHVDEQIKRLGRNHPMVRTQYFSEEIDAEGGMFPAERLALMQGTHPPQDAPSPGKLYALLLDVAGEDEAAADALSGVERSRSVPGDGDPLQNPGRDATALTVVEVNLETLSDPILQAPSYRTVKRYQWTGTKHARLYGQLRALAEHWQARYLVADATGVGAGLVAFLEKALPNVVVPFTFTSKSKSDLGWNFLAVIESGRYKDHVPSDSEGSHLQAIFFEQARLAQSQVQDGPAHLLRWGVPDGTRSPQSGELVHDDLLISAALCAELDRLPWGLAISEVIAARDPLAGMKEVY